jgi:hypothetical protein
MCACSNLADVLADFIPRRLFDFIQHNTDGLHRHLDSARRIQHGTNLVKLRLLDTLLKSTQITSQIEDRIRVFHGIKPARREKDDLHSVFGLLDERFNIS